MSYKITPYICAESVPRIKNQSLKLRQKKVLHVLLSLDRFYLLIFFPVDVDPTLLQYQGIIFIKMAKKFQDISNLSAEGNGTRGLELVWENEVFRSKIRRIDLLNTCW